jgi:hypothetical protein
MLKYPITYTNFDDEEVTEEYYFNLTEPEILDLELGVEGGLSEWIKTLSAEKDGPKILEQIKKIILAAYGVRSEDGKRFVKTEQLREEFSQTAAFPAIFMELFMDANKVADFVIGVVPAKHRGNVGQEMAKKLQELPQPSEATEMKPQTF